MDAEQKRRGRRIATKRHKDAQKEDPFFVSFCDFLWLKFMFVFPLRAFASLLLNSSLRSLRSFAVKARLPVFSLSRFHLRIPCDAKARLHGLLSGRVRLEKGDRPNKTGKRRSETP